MNQLSKNLKALRKQKGLTQSQMALKLNINRPQLGSYEEGRAEPKLDVLQHMALFFKTSIDDLLTQDLENEEVSSVDSEGKHLRILPIVVDEEQNEKISLIPAKAAAGYLNGYADPEYIEQLPAFDLPLQEMNAGTYRLFQIEGDSMEPIPSGSYILAQYELNWQEVKEGESYILLTESDGIVYKRIYQKADNELELHSDNPAYQAYTVPLTDVLEVWKAKGYLSFDLPAINKSDDVSELSKALLQLKAEVEALKEKN